MVRLALEAGVPIVPVVADRRPGDRAVRHPRPRAAQALGSTEFRASRCCRSRSAPPLGINVLDLPGRLPLPAKIELQVLDPIDLTERFGAEPDPDEVYDAITGEMQDALDTLDRERGMPVVG